MGLYNAFRYNYSDLTGCSLLVDVGARTTNLLFIEAILLANKTQPDHAGRRRICYAMCQIASKMHDHPWPRALNVADRRLLVEGVEPQQIIVGRRLRQRLDALLRVFEFFRERHFVILNACSSAQKPAMSTRWRVTI